VNTIILLLELAALILAAIVLIEARGRAWLAWAVLFLALVLLLPHLV
jgi:hypothetical protein